MNSNIAQIQAITIDGEYGTDDEWEHLAKQIASYNYGVRPVLKDYTWEFFVRTGVGAAAEQAIYYALQIKRWLGRDPIGYEVEWLNDNNKSLE